MDKKVRHVVNNLGEKEIDNESLDIIKLTVAWVKKWLTVFAALKIIANVLSWFKKYVLPLVIIGSFFYAASLGKFMGTFFK